MVWFTFVDSFAGFYNFLRFFPDRRWPRLRANGRIPSHWLTIFTPISIIQSFGIISIRAYLQVLSGKTVQEGMGKPRHLGIKGVFLILPNSKFIKIFIIYHLVKKVTLLGRRKNRTFLKIQNSLIFITIYFKSIKMSSVYKINRYKNRD